MRKVILVASIVLIMVLASVEAKALMGAKQVPYEGWVVGAGIGGYTITSNWYWYESGGYVGSRDHWPRHIFSGTLLTAFAERRSFLIVGPFALGAEAELSYGLGGTKEDWLSYDGQSISDGGTRIGTGLMAQFAYPIQISPSTLIAPYPGIGVQFFSLTSNGKGIDEDVSGHPYNYNDGWTESILVIPMSLGVAIEFNNKYIIVPEYRFLIAGGASTDWAPVGYAPTDEGPNSSIFMISFGMKLQ